MNLCTNWNTALHPPIKMLILLATLMMTAAMYLVQTDGPGCFMMFAVVDSIQEKLQGNVMNLVVNPKGWIVIIFFTGSMILMKYFTHWAQRKAVLMAIKMSGTATTTENPIADG